MDIQNSQKKSPRNSAKTKLESTAGPETDERRPSPHNDSEDDRYFDRSIDHVARVRAAKEAAQRKMEEFGDISEYDITIIRGQLKDEPDGDLQSSLEFQGDAATDQQEKG